MSTSTPSQLNTRPINEARMNPFLWRVTAFTVGGMFVDGYILGQIGIALDLATPQLKLDALWLGLIAASSLIGILFGAPLAGRLSDRMGRQRLLAIDFAVIAVVALLHLLINDSVTLVILRLVIGFAIGAEYAIGAALLSEVAPTKLRGVLLSSLNAGWVVGFVIAFLVGYGIRQAGGSWQLIFASTAVPTALVFLLRIGSPESPRWLVSQGRNADALAMVQRYFGPNYGLEGLSAVGSETRNSVRTLFTSAYRTRTIFAGTFWACQVVPLFALTIFLPQVFAALSISGELGSELFVDGMLLLGAIAGVVATKLFSRRGFTIWSFAIVGVALLGMAFASVLPFSLALVAFAVFVLVGSAASNLEFVYPSEIFPTEVRATGLGFAAAVSRLGAAVSTFLLPIALAALGNLITMLVLAGVALLGLLVSIVWAPETKGLSLEAATDEEKAVEKR